MQLVSFGTQNLTLRPFLLRRRWRVS